MRAAVIGFGVMGRRHARVLSQFPDVDLVAVADPRAPSPAESMLDSSVVFVENVEQAVSFGLDLAVVAVPTDQHAVVASYLASRGVATLVEKPLASHSMDALRIVDTFHRAGVLGVVGHIERYNPAMRDLKQRLDAGQIGRPLQLATLRHGPRPVRVRDVGVVLDLATHDLDIGRWIVGCQYQTPAAAIIQLERGQLEDSVLVVDQLPSGLMVSHSVNWLSPSKSRRVTLIGTEGLMTVDLMTAELVQENHAPIKSDFDPKRRLEVSVYDKLPKTDSSSPEPLAAELRAFVAAIEGQPADVVSLGDGLSAVAAAERVLNSANVRRVTEVPYDDHNPT